MNLLETYISMNTFYYPDRTITEYYEVDGFCYLKVISINGEEIIEAYSKTSPNLLTHLIDYICQ